MESILKFLFPKFSVQYKAYKSLIKNKNSYLYLTGWMKSLEVKKSVDINGELLPWMNFPVILFLRSRLKNDFSLFEFGSGHSTTFYANLVKVVTSVEYNNEWLLRVQKTVPENVELIYRHKDIDGEYCRSINSTNRKYDVIIIDGRDRVNCLKQSINSLTKRGVMLLDDSQRLQYSEGIDYAKIHGFRCLDFEGLKPTGKGIDRSTILYRSENCLEI